ncbi:MAG: hypothetical protein PHH54_04820 [Candidatus Nanoarchaeia archaeon]|nr:hypothetical protein [Candidatus Nanoarchaeia archaeon]MDD5741280.1 hypothetical protein [Candidatus Nanoarchaeia archaeon]
MANITKNKILREKIRNSSSVGANKLHRSVRGYYHSLSEKFDDFVFMHIERATNGFRRLTLAEQLNELSAIRPTIEKIADLDNPNHPHIGVARELAEETFYTIRDIYYPALKYPSLLM